MTHGLVLFIALALPCGGEVSVGDPADLAGIYAGEVEELNEAHRARPKGTEAELAKRLPKRAERALAELLAESDSDETFDAYRGRSGARFGSCRGLRADSDTPRRFAGASRTTRTRAQSAALRVAATLSKKSAKKRAQELLEPPR